MIEDFFKRKRKDRKSSISTFSPSKPSGQIKDKKNARRRMDGEEPALGALIFFTVGAPRGGPTRW